MCVQHNVRASTEDNTGQNAEKGHTSNPGTEIKIPDPAGNRTRAARRVGRQGLYRPRPATEYFEICILKLIKNSIEILYALYFQNLECTVLKSKNSDN